jgi:acyl-CoA thioesterase-2
MLDQLLHVITPEQVGTDRFRGDNMHPEGFRVYGGQVLAQAASAALATVEDDRILHSQHAYFLRPGNTSEPIDYTVERARDGSSFSSRRVVALQQGKPILVSSMSFQQASQGDDYQPVMPQVVPPEELSSDRQVSLETGTLDEDFMITTGEDLDVRLIGPVDWSEPAPAESRLLQVWVKTSGPVPPGRQLHQALLAYFSDIYLIDACLMIHGRSYRDATMQVASLDHALWFHEDFQADQWLLLSMEAERVAGGRGLARGRFYTREGRLVATTMQEGLMRFR